jgi:hypothetical protein
MHTLAPQMHQMRFDEQIALRWQNPPPTALDKLTEAPSALVGHFSDRGLLCWGRLATA